MIHEIRRAEALRSLAQWICASLLITLLSSVLVPAAIAKQDPVPLPDSLAMVLWFALAPFLASRQVRQRGRPFDLALPISARRLGLAQVIAVVLAAVAILAMPAVFLVLVFSPAPTELLQLAVCLGVGFALAAAALQGGSPLATLPLSWGRVLLMVAGLGGPLGILILLRYLPRFWTLLILGLTAALLLRTTYRSLPAAFTLMPLAAQGGGKAVRREKPEWAANAVGAGWSRWKLLHHVAGGRLFWLGWPLIFAVGMMVALLVLKGDKPGTFFLATTLFLLSMFLFSIPKMTRLPFFDSLPIGRRALFATLILSNAGVFALGYGAVRTAFAVLGGPRATGPALPVVLLLAGPLWLFLLAVAFATVRPAVPAWVREVVAVLLLFLIFPLGSLPLLVISGLLFVLHPASEGSLDIFIHQLGGSPAGTFVVWLMAALLLLGGYALAEASFRRIELPARPGKEDGVLGLGGDAS